MARISVPLWLVMLSHQLPVIALVGFYPTNKLIGVRLLPKQAVTPFDLAVICRFTPSFDELSSTLG